MAEMLANGPLLTTSCAAGCGADSDVPIEDSRR